MTGTLEPRVPLTGGTPRQIAEKIDWADPWSPDGKTLAVVHEVAENSALSFHLAMFSMRPPAGSAKHAGFHPMDAKLRFSIIQSVKTTRAGLTSLIWMDEEPFFSSGWEATLEGLAWSPNGKEVWFSATHRRFGDAGFMPWICRRICAEAFQRIGHVRRYWISRLTVESC